MKPLLRYTIGPVSAEGFDVLAMSVSKARKLYPEFDILIAYNNLSVEQEDFVFSLGTQLYRQTGAELPIPPVGVAWKLYPPRFRLDAHEIVIDNDLVLMDRIPEIDNFLNSNLCLITKDRFRLYGRFESSVPAETTYNSGLYGMPPKWDFLTLIKQIFIGYGMASWDNEFDEQGLVAKLIGWPPCLTIPLSTIDICEWTDECNFDKFKGLHFIGVNRGYGVWEDYQNWKIIHKAIPFI